VLVLQQHRITRMVYGVVTVCSVSIFCVRVHAKWQDIHAED
jgi:hypothetical protein